jgi:hypothetical protein
MKCQICTRKSLHAICDNCLHNQPIIEHYLLNDKEHESSCLMCNDRPDPERSEGKESVVPNKESLKRSEARHNMGMLASRVLTAMNKEATTE